MIKDDVKHLFDRSACLNKRQFDAYLSGNMITEEVYGVEHHINGCPLCSIAMDGMQQRKDALEVVAGLNSDFIKDHFAVMPVQTGSGTSYMKTLRSKEISTRPVMTTVKVLLAVGACAAILWFVQSVGKNRSETPAEPQQEEVVNASTPPQQEEQQVIVEEPLMAETVTAEEGPAAATTPEPVSNEPISGPPVDNAKPATTKPTTLPAPVTAKPTVPALAKPTATTTKPVATTAKPTPAVPSLLSPPTTVTAPPVVREEPREEPKPVVKEAPREEPKPAPAPKKEEADDLPSDPLAAGKMLMEKRSYNAAITRMRNEMRSTNKARRQEAVMMVARCYQALGNKERAAELLKSIVDEGGPEKKNAKRMLKEVDKSAKDDE